MAKTKKAKTVKKKLTAQNAARAAAKYYREVSGETEAKLRVSEIAFNEGSNTWLITLAVLITTEPVFLYTTKTEYREFAIDASTGEVMTMKIKTLE